MISTIEAQISRLSSFRGCLCFLSTLLRSAQTFARFHEYVVHEQEGSITFRPEVKAAAIAVVLPLLVGTAAFSQNSGNATQRAAAHLEKAQTYLQQKRPDLALPELQSAVKIDPNNVEAEANLGVLLFFRNEYAQAVPALQSALKLQPGIAKIQMLLGISQKRLGDVKDAQINLEKAFSQLSEPKMKIEAGNELIDLYSATGRLNRTADIVAQLETLAPSDPGVLYTAYRLHSDMAGEALLSLSLAAPDSAQMHAAMAYEELRQHKDVQGAIAEYRRALALDPQVPGAHFELAELLQQSGDLNARQDAVREYQAAVRADPYDDKALCKLADIARESGNLVLAEKDYAAAVQLAPMDPIATFGLAKILIDENETSKALPLLERSVQLDPSEPLTHYRLSFAYRNLGRKDEAAEQMQVFLKLRQLKDKVEKIYKQMQLDPGGIKDEKPASPK